MTTKKLIDRINKTQRETRELSPGPYALLCRLVTAYPPLF